MVYEYRCWRVFPNSDRLAAAGSPGKLFTQHLSANWLGRGGGAGQARQPEPLLSCLAENNGLLISFSGNFPAELQVIAIMPPLMQTAANEKLFASL